MNDVEERIYSFLSHEIEILFDDKMTFILNEMLEYSCARYF